MSHWADILLIAPATANTISKIANGQSDNVLTAMSLVFNGLKDSHKVVAPAMNTHMYDNTFNLSNLNKLKENSWIVIPPIIGYMACGDTGKGKLEKPRKIVGFINDLNKNV